MDGSSMKAFLFLLILPGAVHAQKLSMRVFSTRDGLHPFSVERIVQDRRGYLWMATAGGLQVYDGKRFQTYTSRDGLGGDNVRTLVEDTSGFLWVGTLNGGLTRVRRSSNWNHEFKVFRSMLPDPSVVSLFCDSRGRLWAGTKNGVCRVNAHGDSVAVQSFLPGKQVTLITETQDGIVWFGAQHHRLYRLSNETWDSLDVFGPEPNGWVSSLLEIGPGDLWVSSFARGARRLKYSTASIAIDSSRNAFVTRAIFCGLRDNKSRLWFGSAGEGILTWDGSSHGSITKANGLPDDMITTLFEDRDGAIWIGTFNVHLVRLNPYRLLQYDRDAGVAGNLVTDIVESKDGGLWVASYQDGLTRRDPTGNWNRYGPAEGFPASNVYALYEDRSGRLWVSTLFDRGVFVRRTDRFETFRPNDPKFSGVLCFFEDSQRNLWIGTDVDGVYRLASDGQLTSMTMEQGLAGRRVFSIAESADGRLWFGCGQPSRLPEAGGVSVFDPSTEKMEIFIPDSSFKSKWVTSVYVDRRQRLWFGTRYDGLIRVEDDSTRSWTTADGLLANAVVSLAEDTSGRLWIGTIKGIQIMDGDDLFTLTSANGLFSDEIQENVIVPTRGGTMWVGTSQGALQIEMGIARSRHAVTVSLDRIAVNQVPRPLENLTRLSYDENSIAFSYSGIDYTSSEPLEYRFYLEGFDADWQPSTTRDYAAYTNLPAGSYRFHVQSRGMNSAWSTVATAAVAISPAVWQTWWFRGIVLIFVVTISPRLVSGSKQLWLQLKKWRRGRILGQYRLLSVLGEGAMGSVYIALDRVDGKRVALKVLNEKLTDDEENRNRFAREARIMSQLRHDHVVEVYATGTWQGRGYIAMEVLTGGSLRQYIRQHHPLPQDVALKIMKGIADGLDYIHSRHVLHRDLKTDNIMLDGEGKPKIMDFGLSKSALATRMTQRGTLLGTLGYVAPEQITGARVDERSDIFSLGAIYYELLTARLPFSADNEISLIHAIFNEMPEPPSRWNSSVPPALETIVLRCLSKGPEDRYTTALAVSEALSNVR
jgi:tRNA A-37 threonylcarbamoyl transferase component Bud32/streptogramin lyase